MMNFYLEEFYHLRKPFSFGCFHGEVFVGGRGTSKTWALKYVFIFTLTWEDDPI